MIPVFADSFYFFAIMNPDDEAHARAEELSLKLKSPIVTSAWVFTEVADGFSMPHQRQNFIQLFQALKADSKCAIVPGGEELFARGVSLYTDRPDKAWSLTDCISFEIMKELRIVDALTGDHHFEQAGFRTLLK